MEGNDRFDVSLGQRFRVKMILDSIYNFAPQRSHCFIFFQYFCSMKKLVFAVLLTIGFAACAEKGQAVEDLQAEVLELHDSAMVKMDAMYVMIDNLKEVKGVAETDSVNPQPALVIGLLDAITQLRRADDAMMDWMANFETVEKDAPEEESLQYLNQQKASIQEVDVMIDNSLNNGSKLLETRE